MSTVLEGSVQKEGDRFRITAQLINVEDDYHILSEKYDVSYTKSGDIFVIQDKIANAIAERLSLSFGDQESKRVNRVPTESKEAHDWYLKGRFFWNQRNPDALKKGIEFFERSIEADPLYASAYAGLADCYTALGYASFLAPNDAIPKAKIAAAKALEIDSTLAEPHASIGFFKFYYDWDWAEAEKEFKKAIVLNPNYEVAYDWYGYYLTAMERYDEAAAILKKAKDLDPLSIPISTDMGFSLYYSGNYDKALKELQSSLEMSPRFGFAHLWTGRVYQQKKMYKESLDEYGKALLAQPGWTVALAALGNVYCIIGQNSKANKILDTLDVISKKRFVTSYGVALVYAGLGEKDKVFEWLNKAYEERSNWLVWLKSDPRWTILRNDKRYEELVQKVGLPK